MLILSYFGDFYTTRPPARVKKVVTWARVTKNTLNNQSTILISYENEKVKKVFSFIIRSNSSRNVDFELFW